MVETGEAREVSHFALLIGYGAGAINPYLAFETIAQLVEEGTFVPEDLGYEKAVKNYLKATDKGLLKIFAKMGISTLRSYRGAQIFEAIGLDRDFTDRYFTGTQSRVSGVGEDVIARETLMRYDRAFAREAFVYPELDPGGLYQWRQRGERHTFNPDTVAKLQHAVRSESFATFQEYSQAANDDAERLCTLRGILKLKPAPEPVPLDEVESRGEHHAPLLHRRHVLRLDLARGAPDPRRRDEPDRRQEQHRRGRRGSRAASRRCRTATRSAARSSRWRRDASA